MYLFNKRKFVIIYYTLDGHSKELIREVEKTQSGWLGWIHDTSKESIFILDKHGKFTETHSEYYVLKKWKPHSGWTAQELKDFECQ